VTLRALALRHILIAGFGLVLAIATAIGTMSIAGDLAVKRSDLLATQDSRRALLAEHLEMLQQREQVTSRAYFLQPSDAALQRYHEALSGFSTTYRELRALAGDGQTNRLLDMAKAASDEGNEETALMLGMARDGRLDDVRQELGKSVELSKRIRKSLDDFRDYVVLASQNRMADQETESNRAIWRSVSILALGFLLAAAAAAFTVHAVGGRAQQAREAVDEIAKGDLSGAPIEVHTQDALGSALLAVNRMRERLGCLVTELRSIGCQVASAATELSQSSQLAAAGADEQTRRVEQISTAMQEMVATVAQIAEYSTHVCAASTAAGEDAVAGEGAVAAVVAKMEEISSRAGAVFASIENDEEL